MATVSITSPVPDSDRHKLDTYDALVEALVKLEAWLNGTAIGTPEDMAQAWETVSAALKLAKGETHE